MSVAQRPADPRLGLRVVHRRYVPYSHAHYGGNLVDGAYSLACFGDVATEVADLGRVHRVAGAAHDAGRGGDRAQQFRRGRRAVHRHPQ